MPQPAGRSARLEQEEPAGPPVPFMFGFESQAKDGVQSRMETQDASGKVTGSYSIQNADGTFRTVEYYADDTGFHPIIKTNEFSTQTGGNIVRV